tara:strand:+ start:9642 stop:11231 length:1590 start_codon:yes stop_codon:yes gene_type:complete
MYTPLVTKNRGASPRHINTMMPKKGINREGLPQVMDTNFALKIKNYIPHDYGLEKTKGRTKIFERAGANPITLYEEFTPNVWIFGYSTKIEAYNTSTGTFTTIKDDFSANDGFDGARYGDYFFVCNGVEKIYRINDSLAASVITNSPICSGLKVIGPRLYAFNLSTDSTAVQYSEVDDGTNPPFDAWSDGVLATQGGIVRYRNAGTARSVVQLGAFTVVFSDDGFYSFFINTIDAAGTLNKTEVIQNYTEDYGGARGAIETPVGVFYVNEAGLWQMVAVGQTNVPMSRQQILTSKKLLGASYFKDIDQSNTDLVHDINQNCIFMTGAKDSGFNNVLLGYEMDLGAFFEIDWNISRFAKSGTDVYGASSTSTTAYKLFDGYSDDGQEIGTEYYQEIPLGTLFNKHALLGLYAGGFLSPSTELTISFDIYDVDGVLIENKEEYLWTVDANSAGLEYDEWGSAKWADSAIGGDFDTAGLIESFGGGSPRINNMQRLRVRVTGGDELRHIINWLSLKTEGKNPIKRRNISQIT